ncbi:unnamed protein product, partial [Staurois parvus]
MTNFPTNHYHSILQEWSKLLSLFSNWSKTNFDLKGRFLDAMDVSQFPGRKNSKKCRQGTGQSTRDKMYVKWLDTVMLFYVILVYLVNVTFCHFQISCRSSPVRPDVAGDRTQKTDAGIRRRTLQGTLQEG